MTPETPVVYILHGDDEFAITQALREFEGKLGEPGLAEMNTTRLDGRSFNLDELLSVAGVMPFLANRRLVILTNTTERLKDKDQRQDFLQKLEQLPETTALVLAEYHPLASEIKSKSGTHWLQSWAQANPQRVYIKEFSQPRGGELVRWILTQAKAYGGAFTPQAAQQLAALVGDEPRLADQEVHKLLAYVNYNRTVEVDDVLAVTTDSAEGNIFTLVDALGRRDGKQAMGMLERLLEEQDALSIFGMVIRQFRLLIQVRHLIDRGSTPAEMVRALKMPDFVARKLVSQVTHFSMPDLQAIYAHLLDLDEGIKSSQVDAVLALQMLVMEIARA